MEAPVRTFYDATRLVIGKSLNGSNESRGYLRRFGLRAPSQDRG